MTKNKGITIVSLVITIIVLLILAGITRWTRNRRKSKLQFTYNCI